MTKNENVTESVFVGMNRNRPVAVKSHQQVPFTIEAASNSDLSKSKRIVNGLIIRSDVLYAENLRPQDAYNDAALFSGYTCKIKIMIGAELTVVYPIVFLIDTRHTPNFINAASTKSQWNSRVN